MLFSFSRKNILTLITKTVKCLLLKDYKQTRCDQQKKKNSNIAEACAKYLCKKNKQEFFTLYVKKKKTFTNFSTLLQRFSSLSCSKEKGASQE